MASKRQIGILDLLPQKAFLTVGDSDVEVFGIPSKAVAFLMNRYPQLIQTIAAGKLSMGDIVKLAPDAVAEVIACGTGGLKVTIEEQNGIETSIFDIDPRYVRSAELLGIELQVDFILKIGEVTFPSGYGPFVKKIQELSDPGSVASGKARVMNSPRGSKPSVEPPIQESGT
jgi:hypothetical protein